MTAKQRVTDPDIIGARTAIQRAARQARRIAAETNTPLVVFEKGRIVEKRVRRPA